MIALFGLLHLYNITAPPNGYHAWRESDTAVVALNYFQFDRPLLSPMTNELHSMADGLRMEVPVYCWLSAWGYELVGFTHVVPHVVTLLFGCLGLFAFYRLVRSLSDDQTALFSLIALALSPLYFYYSFKIMPDITMLGLTLCAAWLYVASVDGRDIWRLILAALCLGLAASIKPFALAILLPLLWVSLRRQPGRARSLGRFGLFALIAAAPPVLWMATTGWLMERTPVLGSFATYLFSELFLKRFLLQWPWDLFVGWVLLPPFLFGLWRAVRRQAPPFFLWWLAAGAVVVILTARYSRIHDYYSLILTPALAALTSLGFVHLWRARYGRVIAVVLILAAPVGIALRVKDRFAPDPAYHEIRRAAEQLIPADTPVIVADDTRGAVPLYQLNRRGWWLDSVDDTAQVWWCVEQGARYLVLERPLEQSAAPVAHYVEREPYRLGPLYAYRLSRP